MQTAVKKLAAENPEFKKMSEKIEKQGKQFSVQFKVKMFDVLTDEQWKRLLDLTDNPPEYAKVFRKKSQEQKEERANSASWQPVMILGNPAMRFPKSIGKNAVQGEGFHGRKIKVQVRDRKSESRKLYLCIAIERLRLYSLTLLLYVHAPKC